MLRRRLTDIAIERLAAPSTGRLEVWDSLTPSLAIRVGARRRSFITMVRVEGRLRRVTLGVFPGMKIAEARDKARETLALAQNGVDPVVQRDEARAAKQRARLNTVAAVVDEYIERYAKPRQRSWVDTARRLRNHLVRRYGDRPISEITRADVIRVLDGCAADGLGVGANRVLANVKTFFRWCVERGLIERSPAEHVRMPAVEIARDRILDEAELAAVWRAAQRYGFPYGDIVRLLILTGQRRDEVARLSWREIDLDATSWTIPTEKNKSGRPHLVPLSPPVVALLRGLTPIGPLLFAAQNDLQGDRSFSGWGGAKRRIDEISGVSGWRLHDLRRTAATGMARLGCDPHVVERVLNHATTSAGPLARVYQRYAYEPEKRAALEAWAAEVGRIVAAR